MNANRARRIVTSRMILFLIGLAFALWSNGAVQASSLTLKWADSFDDKPVFIEIGPARLFDGKLEGNNLVIDIDSLLDDGSSSVAAVVNVEGVDELAVAINLFKCAAPCKWNIVFAAFEERNSRSVNKICQQNPTSLDGQFKKYFFCRQAYRGFANAGGACWPEARNALTGWFDAAYKLHERTLKGGIGFIARDAEVETLIEDSLQTCPDFEKSVTRKKGYFRGMVQNLNVAILQQTQRVQQSLAADKPAEARDLAESIVKQLDAAKPIRDAVSSKDASFVESVVNRALVRDTQFILR
jgi:hypothetical protein